MTGIEVVDGMVVVTPSASKRHNRLARIVANALDAAAGEDWYADTHFDVRLQDGPLTNRRPDVVVYRADTIDVTPTRPKHVLLRREATHLYSRGSSAATERPTSGGGRGRVGGQGATGVRRAVR